MLGPGTVRAAARSDEPATLGGGQRASGGGEAQGSGDAVRAAQATLAAGSKSFALAGRWLPRGVREDAAVLYAWCRRADDAVDLAPPAQHGAALASLTREMHEVYGRATVNDPMLRALRDVVRRHGIPRSCFDELIEGLAMDARGQTYQTLDQLLVYCDRVAGTVGLMMAHAMGVHAVAPLARAVDLGRAMQLTNICRDVAEDAARGRLYVPLEMLGPGGEASPAAGFDLGHPFLRSAVAALLARADGLYASGRQGLAALPLRCAMAIAAAAAVYQAIGHQIARWGFDVRRGRSVVPGWKKLLLASGAVARTLAVRIARAPLAWARRLAPARSDWAHAAPATRARDGAEEGPS